MSGYIQMNREHQTGAGIGEIEFYRGPRHHRQGGAGIGKYLSRAYKFLKPIVSSGVNALKDQSIESSKSIINQLGEDKLKNILKSEGKRALTNLRRKAINKINRTRDSQSGSGRRAIKRGRVAKRSQTGGGRRRGTTRKKTAQIGGRRKKK